MLADERTLLPLPEPLTYEDGALVACGFGTAWQGILRADVSGRDQVLVTGLGPVGLATLMLAHGVRRGRHRRGHQRRPARVRAGAGRGGRRSRRKRRSPVCVG